MRADPAVVAALDDSARLRLAARFEVAATDDATADAVAHAASPAGQVISLDDVRVRRAVDVLVVGAIADGIARPVADTVGGGDQATLPPLEGEVGSSTAALEARALDGAAGPRLRVLLKVSGALRLERVVGWPAGAIAIGETIYVDASWLVALAPVMGRADAGALGSSTSGSAGGDSTPSGAPGSPSSIALARSTTWFDGGCRSDTGDCSTFDAGAIAPPPPPPPPTTTTTTTADPSFWDGCGAGSDTCAASSDSCDSSDGEDDSCSGTDDGSDSSCSGPDDGSGDSCSAPPDDGTDCRVSPGRERPRVATIVWVLAPLGFLIGRRR